MFYLKFVGYGSLRIQKLPSILFNYRTKLIFVLIEILKYIYEIINNPSKIPFFNNIKKHETILYVYIYTM